MAQAPNYAISFTDGDSQHMPSAAEINQGYKTANDYGLAQKALVNFTNEMMKRQNAGVNKSE